MDFDFEKESKRRKSKEEYKQPGSRMESLPPDIAVDIISRLPMSSLIQFRFVSRAWNKLSHDPNLVEQHFSKATESNPCLILHCDYPLRNQLYFVELPNDLGNEVVRKIQIPFQQVMPEFSVKSSCNGLLCLFNSLYDDPLYIYNPFTREYKELPRSRQFDDQVVVVGFGFHPLTKEYKVVKIVFYWNHWNRFSASPRYRRLRIRGHTGSEVQILRLGDACWRSIGKSPFLLERWASEALVNGRLHWLTQPQIHRGRRVHREKSIVSFDLDDEQFREVPRPDCGGLDRSNYHLTVLGGCLSAVICSHYGNFEIWVMKEYGAKETWIKEFYIVDNSPQFIKPHPLKPYRIWKNFTNRRFVRVLCLLRNGNILIEYQGGVLVSHDPISGEFQKLIFEGMPDMFQTIVHVGSLNWTATPFHTITN